ncbi:cation:proton antiporter [Marinicella sediminis]|uniref:Cation:proton antiporter n=1 Tax=Marinicella sediminis TaxID=1792834 RepID=A0ABV7JCU4_9GAMM|nr:cation:proton antiporter [Marinicella sediminis]
MHHDLLLLAIIWVSVFFAAWLAHVSRLTPVLWFLFFGTLLANLGILPKELPSFIMDLSELGIIIIMFALGFEENVNTFVTSIKRSWGIAFFGALAPFCIAYFLAWQYWGDASIALLCGLAMTATAVSLTMVSLKSEGLNTTPAATGIMTSAVLDDIASLALVAILVPIAAGEGTLSVSGIVLILGKAVLFFLTVVIMGKWLFPTSTGWVRLIPIIGHINLRKILSMGKGEYTILSLLLIAVSVGLLAHEFGFHPAIGAYMAGLVIRNEYFDFHQEHEKDYYMEARKIIDNVAFTWIGPVFFVTMGTHLIFDAQMLLDVLPEAVLLFAGLFVGQILSAGVAAHYTGKFSWPDSWMIGFGMLGRAELAFVVMNIAFVQYQIFTLEVFYTLMITAFLLNISVPITIKFWKVKFASQIKEHH